MADTTKDSAAPTSAEKRIQGDERLTEHAVNLSSIEALDATLLTRAGQSARKCECEGRRRTSPEDVAISACTACTHSTCADCQARPDHSYVTDTSGRMHPDLFEAELKRVLPMRFALEGFGINVLERKVAELEAEGIPVDSKLKKSYLATISVALTESEVRISLLLHESTLSLTFRNSSQSSISENSSVVPSGWPPMRTLTPRST